MEAVESMNFEPAVLDQYATPRYFLGKGSYGNVYGPIPWQGSQQLLAIKQIFIADGKVNDEFRTRIEANKVIWTSLEHKNLMRIHVVDLTRLPTVMFLVMDFAAGGSLHKTIRPLGTENKLPNDVVTDWTKQIAEGMLHLHEKDIVHRDLNSSNILLMEHFDAGNPHTTLTLKIADFDEIKEHDHTTTMSTMVGTCAYMAPEVIRKKRFSKASDVWSFGVVIWEMLSGDIPHKGLEPNAILYKSMIGTLDNLPLEPSFPEHYKLLLNRCWKSKHGERISFNEISIILQRIAHGSAGASMLPTYTLTRADSSEEERSKLVHVDGGNGILRTIRPMKEGHKDKRVKGLTILKDELFVAFDSSAVIEIFHIDISTSIRLVTVTGLGRPGVIAACTKNNCLYIVDKRSNGKRKIIRFDPNGKKIKTWKTGNKDKGRISVNRDGQMDNKDKGDGQMDNKDKGDGQMNNKDKVDDNKDKGRISVNRVGNVVMTVYDIHKLKIYSPEGELLKEIKFKDIPTTIPIDFIFHAINLDDGDFILGHGMFDSEVHRVCKVDPKGNLLLSFGSEKGSDNSHLSSPAYVAKRNDGSILVADQDNNRIILLSSELTLKHVLFTKDNHGVSLPEAMYVDENRPNEPARLFLGCNETKDSGGYVLVLKL